MGQPLSLGFLAANFTRSLNGFIAVFHSVGEPAFTDLIF
jgi:hypothetical protein